MQRLADVTGTSESILEQFRGKVKYTWECFAPESMTIPTNPWELVSPEMDGWQEGSQAMGRGNNSYPGLQSEREHLRMGMRLGRPFNGLLSLKEDHRRAVEEQTLSESEMNLIRLKVG